MIRPALPERGHGIQAGGAPRRQEARDQRHRNQQERHGREQSVVVGAEAEEHGAHGACDGDGAGAIAITRAMRAMLFGFGPNDYGLLAAVALLLIAVALVAGFLPARRAARLDPMTALR